MVFNLEYVVKITIEAEESEEPRKKGEIYIILIESYKITLFLYAFAYNQTDIHACIHIWYISYT